ncbi:MAG: hypothetical protein ACI9E5_000432 [Candidatus Omnitrophota bacterium]|jgi:hypothetical protein
MKRSLQLSLVLLALLSFSASGCIYMVVGGIGALGGYVISPDTVEGITENEAETVYEAAHEILSIMGLIVEDRQDSGIISADVLGTKVTINLIPLTDSTLKVKVKARKHRLPRISVAQDVFVKIMSHVNE